jgi:hypothetical protein
VLKPTFLFLLVALGFLLGACEKEVEGIRLPESDAKLMVYCFISPQDDSLTVSVTRSVPVLGAGNPADTLVEDAAVTLSDGVRSVRLLYDEDRKAYAYHVWAARDGDLKIKPETSYHLQVTTLRGETATATCTVPAALKASIMLSPDSAWAASSNRYYYRMRIIWPDPPNQVNYYRVNGHAEVITEQTSDGRPTSIATVPAEWEASEWVSDEGRDGGLLVSPRGNCHVNEYDPFISCSLYASVLHTDPHYYRYHHSVHRAMQSQANPFAEPVLVYSNVTGGLGVFGAYTRTTTSVRIK